MDCNDIQRQLSDLHGAPLVDATQRDALMAHCEDCPECATFARALAALDAVPRPEAPDRVVRRALEAVAHEREADAARGQVPGTDRLGSSGVDVEAADEGGGVQWFWTRLATSQRVAVVASAAVVFVAGVFVAVRVMGAALDVPVAGDTEMLDEAAPAVTAPSMAAESDADGADGQVTGNDVRAGSAPKYVTYSGHVYLVGAENSELDILASQVGNVTTAKADPTEAPSSFAVYLDPEGTLLIEGSESDLYAKMTPVVRPLDGREFALVSDKTLERYGDWPDLPGYIPTPLDDDGTPIFVDAGTDDRGTQIFTRPSGDPADGFAIAPGSEATDPAGGNPNWTWWVPTGP